MTTFWHKRRTDLKFYVDVLLFLSVVGLAGIGLVLGFVLPKGQDVPEHAKYLLGLHRHGWGDIHLYLGLAFIVLGALHAVLSWSWIKGKARALFPRRWKGVLASMPALAVLVTATLWGLSIRGPRRPADEGGPSRPFNRSGTRSAPDFASLSITGRSSLRDVARETGVPARELARHLGLPPSVPLDEPLRHLKDVYGFSMEDVRTAVRAADPRE